MIKWYEQSSCKKYAMKFEKAHVRICGMGKQLTIVGGGLAGSEAAWQAAERGLDVVLYEMRPGIQTGVHVGGGLAEVVCSNSLGSRLPDRASGILMSELKLLGSLLLDQAEASSVPAGSALAVDREEFSGAVTRLLEQHPRITIMREEVREIPDGLTIIASGPLTSPAMSASLIGLTGNEHLYFYDAISPIVEAGSIDMTIAYRASRYGRGEADEGDYINCPLDQDQYKAFVHELLQAERIELRTFEEGIKHGVRAGVHAFFEGCLPVEIIAERGHDSLAFGPMRPVGLRDPRTGRRPHAVLQLRQDNLAGTLYNLVGFQTNLKYSEQRRVFRMIPGLGRARFARYGQMHRNTFVNAPQILDSTLQTRVRQDLILAGQITGVEGYLGNIATGAVAGINAARLAQGEGLESLPLETMLGSLLHYISHADAKDFQPMKANIGLLPPLAGRPIRSRRERAAAHAERSLAAMRAYLGNTQIAHSHLV
jgi:methylenetetrahydrofolate--tRNA-(uracil-5-)-methyltransferase